MTLFIRLRDKDSSYPTSLLKIIYIISASLSSILDMSACVRACVCVWERDSACVCVCERDSACVSACTRERKRVKKSSWLKKNDRTVEPSRFTCCGVIKKLLLQNRKTKEIENWGSQKKFEAYEN